MIKRLAIGAFLLIATQGQPIVANAASTSSPDAPALAFASKGQMVCDSRGCRQIRKGCHLEYRLGIKGGPVPTGGNVEVCG